METQKGPQFDATASKSKNKLESATVGLQAGKKRRLTIETKSKGRESDPGTVQTPSEGLRPDIVEEGVPTPVGPEARASSVPSTPSFAEDTQTPTLGKGTGSSDWDSLLTMLYPPARKRRPRRWLTSDQKTHRCNIDGCTKSYGSASSLCAHKRTHHPGWKEKRHASAQKNKSEVGEQQGKASRVDHSGEGTPRGQAEGVDRSFEEDDNFAEEEDEDVDMDADMDDLDENGARLPGADGKITRVRSSHVSSLTEEMRNTPIGQWLELLASDAHGRLGALRRSRQRVQRCCREEQNSCVQRQALAAGPKSTETLNAAAAATAASARLFSEMDLSLEKEAQQLESWLAQIDQMGAAAAAGILTDGFEIDSKRAEALSAASAGAGSSDREPIPVAKLESSAALAAMTAGGIASAANAGRSRGNHIVAHLWQQAICQK
ncbi:hypothetical protein CYMTET_18182 [Cymbomonas tetramitiformis]|uniref:C2H2-type domain-containing protein n=1 Tax=Cymbomonas tetramitiformis TaxID=36881 RepID=A0AAE0G8L6_9CHLO|nr:hypothetical protein CYMTET_18182 [Cymbomonas tetramitiformis]